MKNRLKKTSALLLVLAMVFSLFAGMTVAQAASTINLNANGSITIYKYARTTTPATADPAGTGKEPDTAVTLDKLVGSTFSLVQLKNKDFVETYYNGSNTESVAVPTLAECEAMSDITRLETEKHGDDVYCKFENLPVGIYVVWESAAPEQITAPLTAPFLVSIPMVNTKTSSNGNTDWIYDVKVYPKNHESRGNVQLTKKGLGGAALPGVTFELQKKVVAADSTESWADVVAKNDDGSDITYTLTTGTDGKITINNLPSGLNGTQYRLVEVSAPSGYIVNKTPMLFTVNADNTITWDSAETNTAVKKHEITEAAPNTLKLELENYQLDMSKTVKVGDVTGREASAQTIDTIEYTIEVTTPKNVNELKTLTVTDNPGDGITIDTDSIKVYMNDKETSLSKDGTLPNYSVANNIITIHANTLPANDVSKLIITYSAQLNANAVIEGTGNKNSAVLTYSNTIDPTAGATDTTVTVKDETVVYTYDYKINKKLLPKDQPETAAAKGPGVKFELYKADKTTKLDVVAVTGGYRLALDSDTTYADNMVTDANGEIVINGLNNGDYYLKEVETVAGYNLLTDLVKFTVGVTPTTTWKAAADCAAFPTLEHDIYVTTSFAEPVAESTIINKEGFVLPQTGSMGYLLFCAIGLILVAVGAKLMIGSRKNKVR